MTTYVNGKRAFAIGALVRAGKNCDTIMLSLPGTDGWFDTDCDCGRHHTAQVHVVLAN